MTEPWRTTTGCNSAGGYVYGGGTDTNGNLVQTETSAIAGILTDVTKVTKDSGSVDIYVDKTWDH